MEERENTQQLYLDYKEQDLSSFLSSIEYSIGHLTRGAFMSGKLVVTIEFYPEGEENE